MIHRDDNDTATVSCLYFVHILTKCTLVVFSVSVLFTNI